MKDRIIFPVPKTNDIISKGANAGKLGLMVDRELKKKMPDFVAQGDFPNTFKVRGKKARNKKTGSLLSRTKYQQTVFKEEQIDIAGFEAGKVNDYNFRGKGSLKYNPFANSKGNISQTGGYNKGSEEQFRHKKEKDEIIKARFKLDKRNPKSKLPVDIRQPNPFPNQLKPGAQIKNPHGFIIKSRKSHAYAC